jgi:hypothetical protein
LSLVVAVKAGEGMVVCADSRLTIMRGGPSAGQFNFLDHADKVWVLEPPHQHVVVAYRGNAANTSGVTSLRTVTSRWARSTPARLTVEDTAKALHQKLAEAKIQNARVMVAGTEGGGRQSLYDVGSPGEVVLLQPPGGVGISWGGDSSIVEALHAEMDISVGMLGIRGAEALGRFFIETAINAQGYKIGFPSLGFPVRVARLYPNGVTEVV